MKIPLKTLLVFSGTMALFATVVPAQSVTLKRVGQYRQTGASTITQPVDPFVFELHLRGGTNNMTNWGPAFYKPGSSGTPASGPSDDTNTMTLNFSSSPNNGNDYAFLHLFASDAALKAFYPTAPTDGGQYGIKFLGSVPPSPALYTSGLVYATGDFPSPTPQIASANNGATWSGGVLRINPSGTTTLTLNSFAEYATATHGALVSAGIWDASGDVVESASVGGYRAPSLGVNDPAPTSIPLNGAELTPGQNYTLEIQYGIFGGAPANATLNGSSFVGSAGYYKITRITLATTGTAPEAAAKADFNADGGSDIMWRNAASGQVGVWLMNGTTSTGFTNLATESATWKIIGTGDFNSDGQSDVIWRDSASGQVGTWLMNGTTSTGFISLAFESATWKVIGTGDFNADGHSDLIWRDSGSGQVGAWLMNGTTSTGFVSLAFESATWKVIATGDFNADGKTDIVWRDSGSGQIGAWLMNGTTSTGFAHLAMESGTWSVVGTGDFNSDGQSDIIWRDSGSGQVGVWLMNGSTSTGFTAIGFEGGGWTVINN